MTQREVKVNTNMEARPAALFVQTASKFDSNVYVKVDEKKVNAKSIMGMISIGIIDGQLVTIMADGTDADAAISELCSFFTN